MIGSQVAEIAGEVFEDLVGPIPTVNPNRVINGNFSSNGDDWSTPAGGWTFDGSQAIHTGTGGAQALVQNGVFEIGVLYFVSFDVTSDGADIGFENASNALMSGFKGDAGTISGEWLADRTSLSFKREFGTVNGTLDNIIVREV